MLKDRGEGQAKVLLKQPKATESSIKWVHVELVGKKESNSIN